MELRVLQPDDAAAFRALRLAALRECPTAFSSSYEEECDIPLGQAAERLAPNENRAVFGAFDEERLVGTLGIYRESQRKLAHKAVIWGVRSASNRDSCSSTAFSMTSCTWLAPSTQARAARTRMTSDE